METMKMIFISSCLCLLLISLVFINFFYKFWWTPICIQSKMRSQGIKGPSYKFIHGNTKEIIKMRNKMIPMDLSHHIFPMVLPHIYSWIKLYGMNFLCWHGPQSQLVVTQPELIKEILMNDKDGAFPKTEVQGFMKKLLGQGVAASQGEKWFKQRKLANHAFHGESLKSMIPTIIASVNIMLERWRQYEGTEIDVFDEFKVLTSDIISRTAFGSNYLEGEKIFRMLTRMVSIYSKNEFKIITPGLGKLLKTHDEIESDELQQGIRASIMKIIKKREEIVKTEELDSYGSDFLGKLLKAYQSIDEAKKISLDDLIDECKSFYIAGHQTTTNLLSWTILLLATHTDWQDRARKEVLELSCQQIPSPDSISRLKTMSMIINESLRLYAPTTASRKTNKEVKLGKLFVPANMEIYIPILAVHHDPEIWGEDVHLFKPERFAEGVAKATNNNMSAYLPFGLGPRICVGMNFAIKQAEVALSMILQRYKFTLSPTYVHSPVRALTIWPQYGVQVMLQAVSEP